MRRLTIISASRREDMPAFRMPAILREAEKYRGNAFFVLWTKDPRNIPGSGLDMSKVAIHLTVTGFGGTALEPKVPRPDEVWKCVERLIKEGVDPALIFWRMDPFIPGLEYHSPDLVLELADKAASLGISRCVTSFITWYPNVRANWEEGMEIDKRSMRVRRNIVAAVRDILKEVGIGLYGCAQPGLEGVIKPSKCIDGEYLSKVTGFSFDISKDPIQRKTCGCTVSIDIGRYGNCPHKCRYCYARRQRPRAKARGLQFQGRERLEHGDGLR